MQLSSTLCRAAPERRPRVQPSARASASKGKNTMLKGYGNPVVMRRLIDSENYDDDDDFLAEGGGKDEESAQELSTKKLSTKRVPAQPTHLRVQTAEYISSCTKLEDCPQDGLPEFAIIGRSNVGKSSLINMLTKCKNLALTSKQPGKTKCINHFLINDSWYLVDLPGYGYAKASQDRRVAWNEFTKTFFLERQPLVTVFLLVDASVPPQQIDFECAVWLAEANVPFTVVFTKADKARKRTTVGVDEHATAFSEDLEAAIGRPTPSFLTSAANGTGTAAVLRHVGTLRQLFDVEKEQLRLSSPLLIEAGD